MEDVDFCFYCSINFLRLEEFLNNEFYFLFDFVLENGEYKLFEVVYGIEMDDRDRLGFKFFLEVVENDKDKKFLFIVGLIVFWY